MIRKALGFLLFGTGCAFAYSAYQHAPEDRENNLAEVTRILTNPGVSLGDAGGAVAQPADPQSTNVAARTAAPTDAVTDAIAEQTAVAELPPSTAASSTTSQSQGWQSSVSSSALTSTKPGDSSARYELVRSMQKELKRTGCYNGEAHGSWTGSSKRALRTFMERVNAKLPVDEPDYVQLSMLQSRSGVVCGSECPAGQSQSGGQCLTNAIVAHAATSASGAKPETSAAEGSKWKTITKAAAPVPAEKKLTVVASAEPTEAKEVLPWQNAPTAVAPVQRKAPPPGRMAIGAPLPEDVVVAERAANNQVAKDLVAPPVPATRSTLRPALNSDIAAETRPAPATTTGQIKTASINAPKSALETAADPEPDPSTALNGSAPVTVDDGTQVNDNTSGETVDPADRNSDTDALINKPQDNSKLSQQRSRASAAKPSTAKPRVKVSRYYYAAPKFFSAPKVVYKAPSRRTYGASRHSYRSVQSLFQHPLGRF